MAMKSLVIYLSAVPISIALGQLKLIEWMNEKQSTFELHPFFRKFVAASTYALVIVSAGAGAALVGAILQRN